MYEVTPKISAATVAALAPWLTPIRSGLASGFRATVWISAPAIPNAAPT